MNHYLDTEFIEDFTKPLIGKPKHYIELISIGIVSEDNREYYAVSKDFDLKYVWNKYDVKTKGVGTYEMLTLQNNPTEKVYWLRENVLRPIHADLYKNISGDMKNTDYFHDLSEFSYRNLKRLISIYGKTNKQIAADIQCFTAGGNSLYRKDVLNMNQHYPPTFYAYHADYDWVLFCSLFGRMLDLPKGYPMYCRDLKQMMDELSLTKQWKEDNVPGDNEHHALIDARWNQKLHRMLKVYMTGLPQLINS